MSWTSWFVDVPTVRLLLSQVQVHYDDCFKQSFRFRDDLILWLYSFVITRISLPAIIMIIKIRVIHTWRIHSNSWPICLIHRPSARTSIWEREPLRTGISMCIDMYACMSVCLYACMHIHIPVTRIDYHPQTGYIIASHPSPDYSCKSHGIPAHLPLKSTVTRCILR